LSGFVGQALADGVYAGWRYAYPAYKLNYGYVQYRRPGKPALPGNW